MPKIIYSVELECNSYSDDTFCSESLEKCEDYILKNKYLEDDGEVRVALLSVQDDGETNCEALYKCGKAYRVDENQDVVPVVIYTEVKHENI